MRGKVLWRLYAILLARITPAHAGKSCMRPLRILPSEDHPRPCGEKELQYASELVDVGSPPPMRGKALLPVLTSVLDRITPAHAGKRYCSPCLPSGIEDHPRPCGEKRHDGRNRPSYAGSPPPMRGKEICAIIVRRTHGITPAHAGKSGQCAARIVAVWDHPRPCGEKVLALAAIRRDIGSPPPMRGKAMR